jgi:hypothetical protein
MTAFDEPVFVTGADRSGTSLMFALLASHSQLSIVRRTNMWRWFYEKFGDLDEPANLERAIATMRRYPRLDQLNPDWDRIAREFAAGPASYGSLFRLLHGHRAEAQGKPRWGDKSLHTEYFAAAVFKEFPEARIIHVIRDPRDRYASISRRYEQKSKGLGAVIGRWRASVRAADANLETYGRRYLVVRFEDLASDPARLLEETCAFIGEDYEPGMLGMSGAPEHERGNSSFGDLQASTISTAPIGRFRTTLTARDIATIQGAVGKSMTTHGYEVEPRNLSGSDRWSFTFGHLPVAVARMEGWSARDRLTRSRQTVPPARLTKVSG